MELDHEKLDVYRVALDFAAWAYKVCRSLKGLDRPTRDQLVRASQSIALNIAEGCGKIPAADRGRFLQIAGGSARERGAILDILERCGTLENEAVRTGKDMLVRIVAMLTRMIERGNEYVNVYGYGNVYVYGNGYGNEYGYEDDAGQPEGSGDSL